MHGVKHENFSAIYPRIALVQFGRAIYPLIMYLPYSIIPEFNGYLVELVIICVHVCLLCQYTHFRCISCVCCVCVSNGAVTAGEQGNNIQEKHSLVA